MGNVSEQLNEYLKSVFDNTDAGYKSVISNPDGIPAGTIVKPTDYNIGAIASILEWNRQLSISLKKQLFFDLSEGKYLNFIAHDLFGLIRATGENDNGYKTRVKDIIIGHKVSPAAIINSTKPYSSPGMPEIIEGEQEFCFADLSFTENYEDSFQVLVSTSNVYQVGWWVFPAIAVDSMASTFFFVLILENTSSVDIPTVIDIVDRAIAAGIDYEIWILTV